MSAHRRYTWQCEPAQTAVAAGFLDRLMQELPQFFSGLAVTGGALGVAQLSVTISDRDLWWVGRRARILTQDLKLLAGVVMTNEHRVKPPAHDHPNRAARWRGKVNG